MSFNRILRRFGDDLPRPEYRNKAQEIAELTARVQQRGLQLRLDLQREWENAHVLQRLETLQRERGVLHVLDHGGGNSPTCYWLAEHGFKVTVLDVDLEAVATIEQNRLALGLPIRAVGYDGHAWPLPDAGFAAVVSISVFEGLLRTRRARFWSEMRRVLAPGGSVLMTFDYGPGACAVADPPVSVAEIQTDIVQASGMQLVGEPPREVVFDPVVGPPVKSVLPTLDGWDKVVAQYTFAAIELRRE